MYATRGTILSVNYLILKPHEAFQAAYRIIIKFLINIYKGRDKDLPLYEISIPSSMDSGMNEKNTVSASFHLFL
jgi:hypothetical protein